MVWVGLELSCSVTPVLRDLSGGRDRACYGPRRHARGPRLRRRIGGPGGCHRHDRVSAGISACRLHSDSSNGDVHVRLASGIRNPASGWQATGDAVAQPGVSPEPSLVFPPTSTRRPQPDACACSTRYPGLGQAVSNTPCSLPTHLSLDPSKRGPN